MNRELREEINGKMEKDNERDKLLKQITARLGMATKTEGTELETDMNPEMPKTSSPHETKN